MSTAVKKNLLSPKVIAIFIGSFIAALGTMSYGFRFATIFNAYNHFLFLLLGTIFALTAVFANAALGIYSLLNTHVKDNLVNPYLLAALSFISAIPYGFICYFGYEKDLPFLVNFLMSATIVIVNSGIAYHAIDNFLNDVFIKTNQRINSFGFNLASGIGLLIGLVVSITIYIVTVHGLSNLLASINHDKIFSFQLACVLGIFCWIPFAALYGNSTRIVSGQLYHFILETSQKKAFFNGTNLSILMIAVGSGASFTQIAIDFFDPIKDIPAFFKHENIQFFIHHFMIPCAFFSSAAVNYLALSNLYSHICEFRKSRDISLRNKNS